MDEITIGSIVRAMDNEWIAKLLANVFCESNMLMDEEIARKKILNWLNQTVHYKESTRE